MARALERKLTVTASGADHVGKEREALVDRIEGKAVQPLTGKDGKDLIPKTDSTEQNFFCRRLVWP